MKSRYVLWVAKDGKADYKNCKDFNSAEELNAAYESAKEKYKATDEVSGEKFRFATGHCKHNKEVNMSYNETDPLPVPKM